MTTGTEPDAETAVGSASASAGEPAAEPLAAIVERQRRENEHLLAALRTRAVIEQAKGILMARTGVDPETAFQQLVNHSQRTNRKLTRVAAEVVAHTITSPGRPPQVEAGDALLEEASWDVSTLLAAAAVLAAPDLDQLLATVIQHTGQHGVTAGMLALAEPDGALRIVGTHGYDASATSGWRRIPPGTEVPLVHAAERRASVWCGSRAEREERFPATRRFPGVGEACGVVPLQVDRNLVGVLALDWEEPTEITDELRRSVEQVASRCAAPLAELLRDYDDELAGLDFEPGRAGWFWSMLDAQPVPQLVVDPVLEGGRIVDVVTVHANPRALELTDAHPGRSLLEQQPQLAEDGLLDAVDALLRSDAAPPLALRLSRQSAASVSLSRVGTSVLLSWLPSSS
jgi:hypothetical protein